jgi:EmrB/QacA subfamily drug resistance transporter
VLTREILTLAAVVVLGAIMTILDATIVNVALPTLGREFHTSIATIQWVPTVYLLAFASVIPLTGWASERLGAKRLWLISLSAFTLGSLLAGLSWSIGALIAFRVVQGLGGGMIMPLGQLILAQAAGPRRMGRVMSLVGVPMLLAPIFGPVVGGALVDAAGWRWIFFVNLPVRPPPSCSRSSCCRASPAVGRSVSTSSERSSFRPASPSRSGGWPRSERGER